MTIITIPKHLAHKDLVLIPRKEYETLVRARAPRVFEEVAMTKAQKRAFERAERNFANGRFNPQMSETKTGTCALMTPSIGTREIPQRGCTRILGIESLRSNPMQAILKLRERNK